MVFIIQSLILLKGLKLIPACTAQDIENSGLVTRRESTYTQTHSDLNVHNNILFHCCCFFQFKWPPLIRTQVLTAGSCMFYSINCYGLSPLALLYLCLSVSYWQKLRVRCCRSDASSKLPASAGTLSSSSFWASASKKVFFNFFLHASPFPL